MLQNLRATDQVEALIGERRRTGIHHPGLQRSAVPRCKVLGESQDPSGVEMGLEAEALDAAQHGCPSDMALPQELDDGLV